MNTDTAPKKAHHGRNIKRLREMLGIKQETIAIDLDVTQQSISDMEQKEVIADSILEKVAKTLNVPVEAIKNMSDDTTINYINTFNDTVTNNNGAPFSYNYNCTFNAIDKIVELYNEKEALYERMLKEKDALLEKFLSK
ncbi:helix-turn-helix transcriptional regulator [Apibacter raozihei]|uniref:helix-turn-helix domain-containing protein n=1 Tax=Apibacter raozihei TaxID=2500547 RepID=UPI000FE2A7EC|nr:helix-turn-helix transcriptional regulator [Apibacter raozihei]